MGAGIIGLSTAASWINASALLLATGLFLLIGVGSIWVWVFPNIVALLIIAAISGRIKNIPALTQPELMEIRYDPLIRAPVAVAVTIMMILFSATDFIGFKLVLGTFFGTQPLYAIVIMAISVAFYVSVGGFKAVVWADLPKYRIAGRAGSVCRRNGSDASNPRRHIAHSYGRSSWPGLVESLCHGRSPRCTGVSNGPPARLGCRAGSLAEDLGGS